MAVFWILSLLVGGLVAFWAPFGQFCIGIFALALVAAVTGFVLTQSFHSALLIWAAIFFGTQIGYVAGIALMTLVQTRRGRKAAAGLIASAPGGRSGPGGGKGRQSHFRSVRS